MKSISEMTEAERLEAFRIKLGELFDLYDALTLEQQELFARVVKMSDAKALRDRRVQ
jgi:hypothetical protein